MHVAGLLAYSTLRAPSQSWDQNSVALLSKTSFLLALLAFLGNVVDYEEDALTLRTGRVHATPTGNIHLVRPKQLYHFAC